ncbi:MAG: hypothetical protein V4633_07525 [Pseudomonadota bacterium]
MTRSAPSPRQLLPGRSAAFSTIAAVTPAATPGDSPGVAGSCM